MNALHRIRDSRQRPVLIGALLGLIVASALYWLGSAIGRLPDSTRTALIAGCGTIIASVLTVVLTRFKERQLAVEKDQQERRLPVYGEFLDSFQEYMVSPEEAREKKKVFGPFPPALLVWGSDDVVRCWSNMRKLLREEPLTRETEKRFMLAFGDILLAMRRDLGYSNEGLSNEAIIRIFAYETDENERAELKARQLADLLRTIAESSNRSPDLQTE